MSVAGLILRVTDVQTKRQAGLNIYDAFRDQSEPIRLQWNILHLNRDWNFAFQSSQLLRWTLHSCPSTFSPRTETGFVVVLVLLKSTTISLVLVTGTGDYSHSKEVHQVSSPLLRHPTTTESSENVCKEIKSVNQSMKIFFFPYTTPGLSPPMELTFCPVHFWYQPDEDSLAQTAESEEVGLEVDQRFQMWTPDQSCVDSLRCRVWRGLWSVHQVEQSFVREEIEEHDCHRAAGFVQMKQVD